VALAADSLVQIPFFSGSSRNLWKSGASERTGGRSEALPTCLSLGLYINGRIDKRLLVVLTVFPCLLVAGKVQEEGAHLARPLLCRS